jgi:phosphopantothenoylcysteine decarboxylase / phosphopantothenate---cysteine ligase
MLRGSNILLGVTGSIAAYKSAILIRSLVKEGANVKVVMTPSATDFISPLTLATLSKNPVHVDFFNEKSGEWASHVELGIWADLYVIAPATANSIAKFANGICEDLLAAVYLSARCSVIIAPAMDLDMYQHPSTRRNIESLTGYGNTILRADYGELASGLVGEGRMAEPEEIVAIITKFLQRRQSFHGKTALITAGPTYEAIDPVRFIGNHSSGKMGYAIARQLADRGATVTLVSGPTGLILSHPNISLEQVTTAQEMYVKCNEVFDESDIIVFSAAVADYRPLETASEKIKKSDESMHIDLQKTVDIAATLGKRKRKNQLMVGFALESENELQNAKDKLRRKNFDFIVLNSIRDNGAGFGFDTNKISILRRDDTVKAFDLKSKTEVATDIINEIHESLHRQ